MSCILFYVQLHFSNCHGRLGNNNDRLAAKLSLNIPYFSEQHSHTVLSLVQHLKHSKLKGKLETLVFVLTSVNMAWNDHC